MASEFPSFTQQTDLISDASAVDINPVYNAIEDIVTATPFANYSNAETLAATKTLLDSDFPIQYLNPNGTNRDIELPAEAATNHAFFFVNTDTVADLVVKDDSPATIITLPPGQSAILLSDGTTWLVANVGFVGTTGLVIGEIYVQDNATPTAISIAGKANKVKVAIFDTNGESNNMTPDHTNNHINVTEAGIYKATVVGSVSGAGGDSDNLGFSMYKNNGGTEFPNVHTHRLMAGGAGDIASISMGGFVDLAVNDTIEIWAWNEDDTDNITIDDITLSLLKVGLS